MNYEEEKKEVEEMAKNIAQLPLKEQATVKGIIIGMNMSKEEIQQQS